MPLIELTTFCRRTPEENHILMQIARKSLAEAFSMDCHAMRVTINEYDDSRSIPADSKSNRYVIAKVFCFQGRTKQQKTEFFRLFQDGLVECGEPAMHSLQIIVEPPMEDWGFMPKL